MSNWQTIKQRIEERLWALDINVTEAARRANLGKTAVRDIVAGKSKSPTMETLLRLATALECSVAFLLGDALSPYGPVADDFSFRPSVVDIRGQTEANVFRQGGNFPKVQMKHLVYMHPSYPNFTLSAFLVGDNSMQGANILHGDVLTTGFPAVETSAIALTAGMYVVVVHMVRTGLAGAGLYERSLREVEKSESGIKLICRPLNGNVPAIELQAAVPRVVGMPTYLTKTDDAIELEGLVLRITRDRDAMD